MKIEIDHDIFDGRKIIISFIFDDGQELFLEPPLPPIFNKDEVFNIVLKSNLWLSITEAMKIYFGYTASTTWAFKKFQKFQGVKILKTDVFPGRAYRIILTAFDTVYNRLQKILKTNPTIFVYVRLERIRFILQQLLKGVYVDFKDSYKRFIMLFLGVPLRKRGIKAYYPLEEVKEKLQEFKEELRQEGFLF